jgi:hypothetical protein
MSQPSDPQPPYDPSTPEPLDNVQTTAHLPPGLYAVEGFSDRDNFVTDSVTFRATPAPSSSYYWPFPGGGSTDGDCTNMPIPPSPSAAGRPPVLTLTEIKLWIRIEPSQTDEDTELTMMEMAARIHTENYLRQTLDADPATNPAGIGENILMAMLLLIAHWYRNRELMVSGRLATTPFAYEALLSAERDYPCVY